MKYYSINHSLDNGIVGKYEQVNEAVYHCDVWAEKRFIDNVSFKKLDFEPIVANAKLLPKARLTDLISASLIGFHLKLLVSTKFKEILESSNANGFQFFRSPLIHKGVEVENYWILNPFEYGYSSLDFSKTKIYLMENTFKKVKQLFINNLNDYLNEKCRVDKMGYPFSIMIENVEFNADEQADLIIIRHVEGGIKYFVSDQFREKIEHEGCTGIEFQPSDLSFNEWLAVNGERERIYGKL